MMMVMMMMTMTGDDYGGDNIYIDTCLKYKMSGPEKCIHFICVTMLCFFNEFLHNFQVQ